MSIDKADAMRDAFDFYFWSQRKLIVHGSAVEIACACDELVPQIDHFAGPFREAGFPDGFVPIQGTIEPYHLDEVVKHLSIKAVHVPLDDQPFDLYRDGDRYFRVDDTVGLTMVDLVRRRWHSWITEEAMAGDAVRLMDAAVIWPMAQLMALRGVCMIPGVAVVKDNFGTLLLGDLPLEPELSALLGAGYKLVGQRWVALCEEEGRTAMLHVPGHVLRKTPPRAPGRLGPAVAIAPRHGASQPGAATSRHRAVVTQPGATSPQLGAVTSRYQAAASEHSNSAPHSRAAATQFNNAAPQTGVAASRSVGAMRDRFKQNDWVDLHAIHSTSLQNHAFCDAILVCGAGRRDEIRVKQVGWAGAMNVLRRAWPHDDVPPNRRGGKLVAKMASRLRVAELQLSRNPTDLVRTLADLRESPLPEHVQSLAALVARTRAAKPAPRPATPPLARPPLPKVA